MMQKWFGSSVISPAQISMGFGRGGSDIRGPAFGPVICFFGVKNKKRALRFEVLFFSADTRIRTGDLILTKDALYLLSYISIRPGWGSNPRPPA